MEINPKALSKWLKSNGKVDRKKIADILGVSIKTTYQWTGCSDPIPEIYKAKIASIMSGEIVPSEQEKGQDIHNLINRLVLEIDEERMAKYEKAAKIMGMSLREWLVYIVDEAAEEDSQKVTTTPAPTFLAYTAEVIGNIAAGSPSEADTLPYTISIPRPLEKEEYILRVSGKSMEPEIMDGALVIVRRHTIPPIPKPGTIVVYTDERGYTLKRLSQRKTLEGKKEYILKPLNPTFPDITPMDGGRIPAIYVETITNYRKA